MDIETKPMEEFIESFVRYDRTGKYTGHINSISDFELIDAMEQAFKAGWAACHKELKGW